jgi:NAD(P)-dependent dehydrogenase (short-subunit alcohol dehydrogenase family)
MSEHDQQNPAEQYPQPGFPQQDQPHPATLPDTSSFGEQSPLQRPAQPAEMAPAFVFLASQDASYITAEVLNATGGTPLP